MAACESGRADPGITERVEAPLARDALEGVHTALFKGQARAGDEILHRIGDEHLSRTGQRRHARPDVDGDPADLVADHLALAGVKPRAHFDAERPDAGADGLRAADGAGRAIKGGDILPLVLESASGRSSFMRRSRVRAVLPTSAFVQKRPPLLRLRTSEEPHKPLVRVALDQPESGPLGPRPGDFHSPLVELCGGPFWASYGLS